MSLMHDCEVRLWGRRYHHGEVAVVGLVVAIIAIIDDWADRRQWFRRRPR